MKAFFKWVYDWITVLTASLVGFPVLLLQILDAVAGVDITPLVGADKALKIVCSVALAKAVLASLANMRKPS